MRLDSASPRTWLLGAIAAWAVLALLLAIVGMGGRIAPLDEDQDALPRLPAVPAVADARLGPFPQYAGIGDRPLFSNDRRPKPFVLRDDGGDDAPGAFDYVLTSVLITPRLQMAIIQPADGSESVRVKLDESPESHPDWRLVELEPRSAVFDGPEGRREMKLRVFNGEGGQAPTVLESADAADGAGTDAAPAGGALPVPPPGPAVKDADEAAPDAGAQPAMTPQSQMEAIRQRIQARRAALREQQQDRQNPPRPQPVPPNPPAESR